MAAVQPPQPLAGAASPPPQPQPLLQLSQGQQGTGHMTVTGTCLHTQWGTHTFTVYGTHFGTHFQHGTVCCSHTGLQTV
jgi:hypothetical protein